jgi:hypothetical protein
MIKSGYGLRDKKTKELVGVSTSSNAGGYCCGEFTYTLCKHADIPWIVEDKLTATYVKYNSTNWYNADYETPVNELDPDTLEVVKIETKATSTEDLVLPTFEEYMQRKYNTKKSKSYDPGHYEYIMKEYRAKPGCYRYTIYDIRDMVRDKL